MLLIIHNLPASTLYSDVKSLIKTKCGLTDVILDNLVNEGSNNKKVTVGLADEGDAAILVRKINGLFMMGQQLYVEDVRKKKQSEQPYRSSTTLIKETQSTSFSASDPKYQDDRQNQSVFGMPNQNQAMQNPMSDQLNMLMNYNMNMAGMMYMPTMSAMGMMPASNMVATNTFMGYGTKPQDIPALMGTSFAAQNKEISPLMGASYSAQSSGETSKDYETNRSSLDLQSARASRDADRNDSPRQDWASQASYDRGWSSNQQNESKSRWDNTAQNKRQRSPSPQSWRAQQNEFNKGSFNRPMNSGNTRSSERSHNKQDSRGRYFDLNQDDGDQERASNYLQRSNYSDRSTNEKDQSSITRAPVAYFEGVAKSAYDIGKNLRSTYDEGKSMTRPPYNQGSNLVRSGYNQGSSNVRPSYNQGSSMARPAFDQGNSMAASRPKFNQGKNSTTYSEDKGMSRPPRPETRRQQEQPRGMKRAPEQHHQDDNNPAKKFASSKPPSFDRAPMPPPGRSGNDWKSNTQPNLTQNELRPNMNTKDLPPELRKKVNKDETFRGQAASLLAKQVVTKLQLRVTQNDPVFRKLKTNLRERINSMFGDKLTTSTDEVVLAYRNRYPTNSDQKLYRTVLQQVKQVKAAGLLNPVEAEMVNKAVENAKSKPPPKDQASAGNKPAGSTPLPPRPNKPAPFKPGENMPPPNKGTQSKPAQSQGGGKKPPGKAAGKPTPQQPKPGTSESNKLVPNADKATRKQIKREKLEEFINENMYELPPLEQKALDEEADLLCDLFMGECQEPEKESEKKICEIISDTAGDIFRKVVRLQVTKRLLNICTGLQLRVMFSGPPPKPHAMDRFFAQYGVESVYKTKKNKPMYLVNCKSFEAFDQLCKMRLVVIDNVSVQIRPFQITGPTPKYNKKVVNAARQARINREIDHNIGPFLRSQTKPESYNDDIEVTNFDDENGTSFEQDNVNNTASDTKNVDADKKVITKSENVDSKVKSEVKEEDKGKQNKTNEVKKTEKSNEEKKTEVVDEKKDVVQTEDTSESKGVNDNEENTEADWANVTEIDDDWPVPEEEAEDWMDQSNVSADTAQSNVNIDNVDDIDVNEDELEDY